MVSPVSNPDNKDSGNKPEKEKEEEEEDRHKKKDTLGNAVTGRIKSFIKPRETTREANTPQEFLTKNTIRLIENIFWFLGIILVMFVFVAMFRETIVEKVLPLFTLVIGGILGFLSKDILRNDNNTNNNIPPSSSGTPVS